MKKPQKKAVKKENTFSEYFRANSVTVISLAVGFLMCAVTFYFDYRAALAELCVLLALVAAALIKRKTEKNKLLGMIKSLDNQLSAEKNGNLKSFPLPVVIFDSLEKVVWFNNHFRRAFLSQSGISRTDIKQFTSGKGVAEIRENTFIECEFNDRRYTAFCGRTQYKGETVYALYYIDDTRLKKYKSDYENSRPVVMFITVDGTEEALKDFRESQMAEIAGGIETIIENWFSGYECIVKKMGSGRFIVIAGKESLSRMKNDKFSVLSSIRSYTYNGRLLGISLSVGAGTGESFPECEKAARVALDMALGRGGDQVAIKGKNNEYEFFGGVSKGVEKRTKVKTRMVASAVAEMIKTSSNVLIMGHRFADLDALGASVGAAMICRALGREAKIVISSKTTLATPLYNYLSDNGLGSLLIEPEAAASLAGAKTLLIVVDTHRKSFLEAPDIYDAVSKVVVIDHHRKTVDHINKAVIFYHEPYASSASELVTELIQYSNFDVSVPAFCAEALLSGITLDTKNFVMKTGVRTFEAAAYLRSLGADTVAVKQLFSNSMKTQKDKSEVVKNAAMYGNCAVGVVDFESDNIRIVASQAADELLNVEGVDASFVLFRTDNTINVSARSYGEVNVQLVMEELGGGGHQTMAAAQLPDETFENALKLLKNAVDKVREADGNEA